MTKRDLFLFLFRWYRVMAFTFLFIIAIIVLLQYAIPQKYSAKSVLLVEYNRSPTMRSDYSLGLQSTETMNTEVAIIASKSVLADAVDELRPFDRSPTPSLMRDIRDSLKSNLVALGLSEETSGRDNWIKQLQDNVKVEAPVQSNIINVSYSNENPAQAAEIVNTIVTKYIDHRLEIFSPENTAIVYQAQMDQILAQLAEHRKQLEKLNQSKDLNATSEQRGSLLQQRSLLMERIVVAEVELADLSIRFSPGHDRVRSTNQLIANYKQEIDDIDDELRLLDLVQSQTAQLRLNIESEEALYQAYKTRYDEERLKELATTDFVNIRVVEEALPASRPDHSRLFYIVIGSAGSLVFIFGICLLFEYFDRRIRNIETAEEILGITSLGSVARL